MAQDKKEITGHEHEGFPWKQVIGFVLSIVLTIIAMWIALGSGMSKALALGIVVVFAFGQAAVQLFLFMHVTEGDDGKVQTTNMIHAFIAFIIVIGGSIWVMSFGMH